jgi:hypothetical protein
LRAKSAHQLASARKILSGGRRIRAGILTEASGGRAGSGDRGEHSGGEPRLKEPGAAEYGDRECQPIAKRSIAAGPGTTQRRELTPWIGGIGRGATSMSATQARDHGIATSLHLHLKDIQEDALLTAAEERELAAEIARGDSGARRRIGSTWPWRSTGSGRGPAPRSSRSRCSCCSAR